jgi:hypothetical protein
MSDYKWVTEGPDFAFTDDERFEVSDTGDGFTLRENLTYADPNGADPDWNVTGPTFGSMADAKAYADERQAVTLKATPVKKTDLKAGQRTVLGTVTETKLSPSRKTIVITVRTPAGDLFTDRVSAAGNIYVFTDENGR